jgi:hypothetical protein
MKLLSRLMLIACLVLPFAACKKEAPVVAAKPPVTAPKNEDVTAWHEYMADVVQRNDTGTTAQFGYFLPGESTPDFQSQYDRLAEKVKEDIGRGVVSGTMLAFGSPASAKLADMIVAAFKDLQPGSLKGVKVLFIGKAEDSDRVKAAVQPAGDDYTFVEAK